MIKCAKYYFINIVPIACIIYFKNSQLFNKGIFHFDIIRTETSNKAENMNIKRCSNAKPITQPIITHSVPIANRFWM